MQATITYLLTEQAQRAQMAATGQPVARQQTITIDVSPENLDIFDVAPDGAVSLIVKTPEIPAFGADVLALYRTTMEMIKKDFAAKAKDAVARDAANCDVAINLYLADGDERHLYNVRSDHPRQSEVRAEREKRRLAASAAYAAKEAVEAVKAAERERVEAAKTAYIAQWIADMTPAMLGAAEIQQQFADGLLCRKTAISLIADAAFAAAGVPEMFTAIDPCDNRDCPCGETTIDCLPLSTYPAWKAIKAGLPAGYTVKFSRYRECFRAQMDRGYEEPAESAGPTKYLAEIKLPHGPFVFERTVEL